MPKRIVVRLIIATVLTCALMLYVLFLVYKFSEDVVNKISLCKETKAEEPSEKIIESSTSERCHSAVLVNIGTGTRGYIIQSYQINAEGLITFVDCASKKTYKASNYLLELGVNQDADAE